LRDRPSNERGTSFQG